MRCMECINLNPSEDPKVMDVYLQLLNIRLTVYEFLIAYDLKLRASRVLLGRGVKAARERAN